MKILQLGNGGGLDVDQTNSSFLIKLEDKSYLLVDCGFNVMAKLKELNDSPIEPFRFEYLNYVYITHTHEDHVGNLSTLIYHTYFMLNHKVTIFAAAEVLTDLEGILSKCKTELKSGQVVPAYMYKVNDVTSNYHIRVGSYYLHAIENYHPGISCYGILLSPTFDESEPNLYISGDTKAYAPIEDIIPSNTVIFHDFSNWNNPSRNVHACESDIASEYSTEFITAMNKYHNGSIVFYDKWQPVNTISKVYKRKLDD